MSYITNQDVIAGNLLNLLVILYKTDDIDCISRTVILNKFEIYDSILKINSAYTINSLLGIIGLVMLI